MIEGKEPNISNENYYSWHQALYSKIRDRLSVSGYSHSFFKGFDGARSFAAGGVDIPLVHCWKDPEPDDVLQIVIIRGVVDRGGMLVELQRCLGQKQVGELLCEYQIAEHFSEPVRKLGLASRHFQKTHSPELIDEGLDVLLKELVNNPINVTAPEKSKLFNLVWQDARRDNIACLMALACAVQAGEKDKVVEFANSLKPMLADCKVLSTQSNLLDSGTNRMVERMLRQLDFAEAMLTSLDF